MGLVLVWRNSFIAGCSGNGNVMLDFERFYLNTKNIVYQYLYQHVNDFFETEDIAQEAYLMALEGWDMLQEHPNPAGWIMQTAKNLSVGFHRHVYYRMESIEEQKYQEIPYEEPVFDLLLMEDIFERVYNTKERPIAKKYFLEEDSLEDLSAELGISAGCLRTRLYRMRRRLKSYIESGEKVW